MSESESRAISRRAVIKGAAGGGAAGVLLAGASPASAHQDMRNLRVRERFVVVDRHGRQRFLHQTSKPPVIINGMTIPAEERGGPVDASYFIYNDQNGSERGGLTASTNSVNFNLDYSNAEAIRIESGWDATRGHASVTIKEMPDPSIQDPRQVPPDTNQTRVTLGWDNRGTGSALALHDSNGIPRLFLQVDQQDNPHIYVLNAQGGVERDLLADG